MAAAATATAAGTDNNQLKAVMAMANGGDDGNSDNDKVTCIWKGIKKLR